MRRICLSGGLALLGLFCGALQIVTLAEVSGTAVGTLKLGDEVVTPSAADAALASLETNMQAYANAISNALSVANTNAVGVIRAEEISSGYYRFYVIGEE